MSRKYVLVFLIVMGGSFSLSLGQEASTEITALLEQLSSERFATRQNAVDQLAKKGDAAIIPLFQLMRDNNQDLETLAKCGQFLVEISGKIEPDTKASKTMIAEIKKLLDSQDSKLVGIAERLRAIHIPSIEEVQKAFRSVGCRLSSFAGLTRIELDQDFLGTSKTLRLAKVFKKGVWLQIDISFDLEYYKILPSLNLKKLVVQSSRGRPADLKKDQIVEKFQELAKCKGVYSLHLFFDGCPNQELGFLRKLPLLTELQLPSSTTDEELKIVADCIHLQSLEITNCRSVKGYGFSFLKNNKALESLDLYTCLIEDRTLKSLSELTQLSSLLLPQKSTNSTLQSIAGLKNLESLSISNTTVTDEGIDHLLGLKKLTRLVLSDSPLTDKSIPRINSFPNLRKVFIYNTLITAEEANGLRMATGGSEFPFVPEDNKQKQMILDLVQSGVNVQVSSSEPGQFVVRVISPIVDDSFSDFREIAKLKVRALVIDYKMSPVQAKELCTLDQSTGIYLLGTELPDEVAELFHQRFNYVTDNRNGKKRITNKRKR